MKLVRTHSLASLDEYQLIEAPDPVPRAGEVLIEVAACSLGYVDGLLAVGGYQIKPPVPYTPGSDVAGVVAAVGEGVDPALIGARVMAQARAGLAELAVAPARAVVRIADAVAFETGAVFQLNYATALHGLRERAQLRPGERLLVFGAAGGVGSAAIDVGRMLGANVVAVASTPEKRAFALAHGAHAALDTTGEGWRDRLKEATGGKGVDVIFDPVCGPLFEPAFRSLAWRGRHLVVGFVGGQIPALPANLPLMKGAALIGVDVRQFPLFQPDLARDSAGELLEWLAEGRLNPAVGEIFALEDFRQALEHAMSGQGMGKTVVKMRL